MTKKWHKERKTFQVGDIVIAISPDSPRRHWPLAIVTQVYSTVGTKITKEISD